MNILDALKQLRDDIKTWVTNNLNALNAKIDEKTIPIDKELSATSTNPVQNKTITNAINNIPRFSGNYNDLTDAPNITEDESGNMVIADESGNIIFKADVDGIHTTAVSLNGEAAASEKYVDEAIANIPTPDVSGQINAHNASEEAHADIRQAIEDAKEELSESIVAEANEWKVVDEAGNIIFSVDASGAHTTELTLNGESAATEQWVENKNYLTEHQDISGKSDAGHKHIIADITDFTGYATETYVDNKVADLVNSAPEALNTLGELAAALENHEDAYDALLETVGSKATHTDLENLKEELSESITAEAEDWKVVDGNGNIIFSVDNMGAHTTSLTLNGEEAATKTYVDEAIGDIEFPETDFTGYATEDYVDEAIAAIDIPETDLSDYYTKEQTDTAINTAKEELSESIVAEAEEWKVVDEAGNIILSVDADGAHTTALTLNGENIEDIIDNKISHVSTGGGEAIIDVTSLPIENINKNAFYRLLTGTFVYNQFAESGWTCYCVEALPETGEPVTLDMASITAYYNMADGDVYGYVNDMLATQVGVPVGWHPLSTLAPLLDVTWSGVITDIADDPLDDTIRLFLEYVVYYYKDGWVSMKTIGAAGTGVSAEVFNHAANKATGDASHAEGQYSHAEGHTSHAEGWGSHAEGDSSHAEGSYSHSEGYDSHAEGYYSHAEGWVAHAEGYYSHAKGHYSHAEGDSSYAEGDSSHAEGQRSHAQGNWSHAEGADSHAQGDWSHAEGLASHAEGHTSHAEGVSSHAAGRSQHVQGEYNRIDPEYNADTPGTRGKYAHIVGNGTSAARSNAHTLDWNGNGWFAGDVYVGGSSQDDTTAEKLATEAYVDIRVPAWTSADEGKFLRIVNGTPAWVSIPNAEEAEF